MIDNILDIRDPDLQELIMDCMDDTRLFAKTFFPEEVFADFSILHDEIFRVVESAERRKALAAPRGLGKTTIAKIRACKAILFREVHFIIYLSNSATNAEMQTESIKRMLQTNPMVKKLFGNIKMGKEGLDDTFSKKSWTAFGDVFVLPRGAGQQVRGLNWMGHRPELIIIDDLETIESVQSDEQRAKLFKWFMSDLMKTESMYGRPAEIFYIDTIKHEQAILQRLMDAPEWESARLSICNDDFTSLDPNYMTTEEIKKEYAEHVELGEADLFYMERMNIPISLKDAIFKTAYFKYFREEPGWLMGVQSVNSLVEQEPKQFRIPIRDLVTIVIVDPARTVKLHSAESAVVVVSVARSKGLIFVRDVVSKKVHPDELYAIIADCCLSYNAMLLAVEVTGLHEFISQPLQNYLRQRSVFVHYIELNATGDKDMRIATLAPGYRIGYIYHHPDNCVQLENQLKWHPKSKLKDVADAFSYITKIMDEQYMYFDPVDEEDEFGELEDEFAELHDEEALEVEWRLV